MLGLQYTGRVLNYWRDHRPIKYREAKKEGTLDLEAQRVSRLAAEQVAELMDQGFSREQAEEYVLPETVYAPPGGLERAEMAAEALEKLEK